MTDWLPPQAPTHPPDGALPRAPGAMPRPRVAAPARAVRSPRETAAIGVGSVSILLLALTAGMSCLASVVLSTLALWLGRPTGRRAAVVVAVVGLALGAIAAITWSILVSQGVTPQDLQDWARAR